MKKLLTLFSLFFLLTSASAEYYNDAKNGERTFITQPDGEEYSVYQLKVSGYKYIRSPNGNVLMKNPKTNWFEVLMLYEIDGIPSLVFTGRKYKPKNKTFIIKDDHLKIFIWETDIKRVIDYKLMIIKEDQELLSLPQN